MDDLSCDHSIITTDVDILVEMGKFARKVANTEPLKDLIASELNPGAEVQTDEQWAGTSVFPSYNSVLTNTPPCVRMGEVGLAHDLP